MKLNLFTAGALVLATLLSGCGGSGSPAGSGSNSSSLSNTTTATVVQKTLEQAMLEDPNLATAMVLGDHVNAPRRVASDSTSPTTITVAALQSGYEMAFCQLSDTFNVTLQTPQSVDKINFIKSQPETGHFDLLAKPIENNPVGVVGVVFQPITYQTTVPLPAGDQTFTVSGGLLMPLGLDKTKLKGVVVYFHGTTFNKSQVGSNFSSLEVQLVAQVFASQGYAVVVPDYVGQGVDWQNVHPYVLYPRVSVKTAVDMLSAVKPLLVQQYGFTRGDPQMKVFSTGYSEGGSYGLWFNIYLASTPGVLDPFYRFVHAVGMEGAYSTSQVTYDYMFSNVSKAGANTFNVQTQALVNLVKPVLVADAFLSYAAYTQGGAWLNVFSKPYFNLDCALLLSQSLCDVNGQRMNIAQAFAQPNTTVAQPLLVAALGKSANGFTYPGTASILTSTTNNVAALMSATLLTPTGQQQLMQTLQAADADLSGVADGSCSIISLAQDSVVVSNNFDVLAAAYPSKLANTIKVDQNQLIILSPFSTALKQATWAPTDHLHGLIYEYLYALHIFDTH